MSQLQRAFKTLGGLALVVAFPALVFGQSTNSTNFYAALGGEFAPAGNLLGDQINPSLSLNASGGLLVWQDNITDGDGFGISAVRLDQTFTPTLGNFRVNVQGAGDQENPQVALLPSGGAAIVWQSGLLGFQHIVGRFLSSSNLFITSDVPINSSTNHFQSDPAIAALANGNLIVTWSSYGQDAPDGFPGVYAQIMSPTGQKIGGEFQVNQFSPNSQRSPAVAAFPNGSFIISWVSEKERFVATLNSSGESSANSSSALPHDSIDIYARVFDSGGNAVTNSLGTEFRVNTEDNVCANPAVAAASDNTFIVSWSQKDTVNLNNSWDIFARQFSAAGVGSTAQLVNSQLYGDQYAPKISSIGNNYLVVWTSMGQDGSREGVYSQFLKGDGSHSGGEQRVNTTVLDQQEFPTVASDGVGQFIVVWSSFTQTGAGLDLSAQRYGSTQQPLAAPPAPFVMALDDDILSASWPSVVGLTVSYYELVVDGVTLNVTNNMWSNPDQDYNAGSTHTFQLAYVLTDGRISPLSASVSGTTWGQDNNHDGLPDNWQTLYYGTNKANWPGAGTLLAPGVTALDVFYWGADPTNPNTWLKQSITQTKEGLFLNWNTVPGGIYQVLSSTDFKTWAAVGSPRFEAGTTDSIFLGGSNHSYFRIVRNRY